MLAARAARRARPLSRAARAAPAADFWSNRVENGGTGAEGTSLAHCKADRSRIGPDIKLIDEWLHYTPGQATQSAAAAAAAAPDAPGAAGEGEEAASPKEQPAEAATEEATGTEADGTEGTAATSAEERARILERERHMPLFTEEESPRTIIMNMLRESPSLHHLNADVPDNEAWAERLRSAHEARSSLQPGCEMFVAPSTQWKVVGAEADDDSAAECHPAWTPEQRRIVHPSGAGHLMSSIQRMMLGMEEEADFQEGLRHSFAAVTALLGDSARNATLKLRAEAKAEAKAEAGEFLSSMLLASQQTIRGGDGDHAREPQEWILHPHLEGMLDPALFRSLGHAVARVAAPAGGPIAPLDPASERDHSELEPLFHVEGVLMSEPFISVRGHLLVVGCQVLVILLYFNVKFILFIDLVVSVGYLLVICWLSIGRRSDLESVTSKHTHQCSSYTTAYPPPPPPPPPPPTTNHHLLPPLVNAALLFCYRRSPRP